MVTPTDQPQRLAAQLTLFKDRLLDIDTRNPCLFLRREVQERAFDLARLDVTLAEGCYTRLMRGGAALKLVASNDDSPEGLKRAAHLQKLLRAARAREEETGLRELYVGLCFVTGHLEPRTFLRGPLLLVPARLEKGEGKREARYQLQLEPAELVVNAAILGALRKHRGLRLAETLEAEICAGLEQLGTEPLEGAACVAAIQQLTLRCFAAAGLALPEQLPPAVQLLTPLTKKALPDTQVPLRLSAELVLGLFPQSGSALYADFDALIERARAGEGEMGLVDDLLEVPAEKFEDAPENSPRDLPEGALHCVIATDPSQRLVVKQAQTEDALVVRGPPGTGKSQTIVNLVSDALARHKRVLVVCQKRAALDVVYRRLSDVGLSASVALVHDASADRNALYKRLAARLQASAEPPATSQSARVAERMDELTRKLRALVDPLGGQQHGLPLHALYGRAQHGFRPRVELPDELVRTDLTTVERVAANVERLKSGHLRFDQPGHALAMRRDWSQLGNLERNRLEDALRLLLDEARRGGAVPALESAQVGLALTGQLSAFLATRARWYRWLLPSFWRAKAAVERALSLFGAVAPEGWQPLIDRHARLEQSFALIADLMQPAWRTLHQAALSDLPRLVELTEGLQRAVAQDFEGIRAHDRQRAELSELERTLLPRCAAQLPSDVSWAEQLLQSTFVHWIDEAERAHPRLREPVASEHAALVRELRSKDDERSKLVARELAAALHAQATTPSFAQPDQQHGNRKASTDWNKLAHELGKKSRIKSLRALNAEFDWPMRQQVRCWLASPEVVAEVFALERGLFDLVVFDEASQLTLERALPVVYRARQVVIAGDEQQMPPSNFFATTLDDDEEDEEEEAPKGEARFAESLLVQGKRIRGFSYLAWHYRSAFQQLIEFSNHAFYDGMLQIAANLDCDPAQAPMRFIRVAGVWENQTNVIEARRTVDELESLLREHDQRSLGVITFNQKQQELIKDEIEARRERDPAFKQLWERAENPGSGSLDDRPFVKNIENVQGDERDYIVFSVGYAPGADGVLRRNFGPLGLSGGENRLNVAITRAKRGVRVICSFDPDKFVAEGAKNPGPMLLKQYLCYVQAVSDGNEARIQELLSGLDREQRAGQVAGGARFDSPFEEQVHAALTQRGLTVRSQHGAGGYHIDLVVVDPKDPTRLCLGIECDGAAYHGGQSVRERDIARQALLESRGWRMHRIWSSDWWRNPEAETQRVLELVAR